MCGLAHGPMSHSVCGHITSWPPCFPPFGFSRQEDPVMVCCAASGNLRLGLSPLLHTAEAREGSPTLPGHKATAEWKLAAGVRRACAAQGPHVHRRLVVYPGQQEQDQRDPNFMLQVPSTDLPSPRPHGPVKVAAPHPPHPQAWSPPGNSPWLHPDQPPQPRLPLETWSLQALTFWAGSVSGVTWRRVLVRQKRKWTQSRVGRARSRAG